MTLALVSMRGAADARGVHYDTFRKHWRTYVRDEGFPAPVKATRPYQWRPAALTAWQVATEAANHAWLLARPVSPAGPTSPPSPDPAPANDAHADPAPTARRAGRIDRQRAAALSLMTGA